MEDTTYVYNEASSSWVSSDKIFNRAINFKDKAYCVENGNLFIERKNRNALDYSKFDNKTANVSAYSSLSAFTLDIEVEEGAV